MKYLIESPATAKGHLDQEQKKLQTTKSIPNLDAFPTSDIPNTKKREQHTVLFKHTAFCDPTGRFPYYSANGNQYVFVTYNYDSNYIQASTVRSRQAKEFEKVWENYDQPQITLFLTTNSVQICTMLYKNIKYLFKKYLLIYTIENAAERAIRTFKNHFLQVYHLWIQNFQLNNGIISFNKPRSQ